MCLSVCLGSHTHPNMVGMYIWEAISLHMAENFSPNCGINSPTKVIYSWVLTVVRVHGTNDFFHYFNLKKKETTFTKKSSHVWFPLSLIIFFKWCIKYCNFEPFCYLLKSALLRNYANKRLHPSKSLFLTVLLSLPFNKLPCSMAL